tara:strand:+ start:58 stop:507 length:450 start_codon:yes stop_codon:yes gene_type:complete
MLLGVSGAGYDAIVTFSSFSGGNDWAGFSSTPVVLDDPDSIIQGIIFYFTNAGIKLETSTSYDITVIDNYSSASGGNILLGQGVYDSGNEFQNYNLNQTIGTLWDTSSFNNFTASFTTSSYNPALVVDHPIGGGNSGTGTLKLGITKTS